MLKNNNNNNIFLVQQLGFLSPIFSPKNSTKKCLFN